MYSAAYIEINVLCLILLSIIYLHLRFSSSTISNSKRIMFRMLIATAVLCASDILAFTLRGQSFGGANVLIQIANLINIEMMPLIAFFWIHYVCAKLRMTLSGRIRILMAIPLIASTILAVINPWTEYLFRIDENNLYVRGNALFVHWAITWIYMIVAAFIAAKALRKAPNSDRRKRIRPLLFFFIFPTIGGIAQMLFYGVTSVQAGITLSLVLISQQIQDTQSSIDSLTRIKNRKAMNVYVDHIANKNEATDLTVLMIDINHFKKINDTLGHAVGDEAISEAASILKSICDVSRENLSLFRFGGDEFVIIGQDMTLDAILNLITSIQTKTAETAKARDKRYTLEFSIGYAGGLCAGYDDFNRFLQAADQSMYEQKHKAYHSR